MIQLLVLASWAGPLLERPWYSGSFIAWSFTALEGFRVVNIFILPHKTYNCPKTKAISWPKRNYIWPITANTNTGTSQSEFKAKAGSRRQARENLPKPSHGWFLSFVSDWLKSRAFAMIGQNQFCTSFVVNKKGFLFDSWKERERTFFISIPPFKHSYEYNYFFIKVCLASFDVWTRPTNKANGVCYCGRNVNRCINKGLV